MTGETDGLEETPFDIFIQWCLIIVLLVGGIAMTIFLE